MDQLETSILGFSVFVHTQLSRLIPHCTCFSPFDTNVRALVAAVWFYRAIPPDTLGAVLLGLCLSGHSGTLAVIITNRIEVSEIDLVHAAAAVM
jgi:hypothetical protein